MVVPPTVFCVARHKSRIGNLKAFANMVFSGWYSTCLARSTWQWQKSKASTRKYACNLSSLRSRRRQWRPWTYLWNTKQGSSSRPDQWTQTNTEMRCPPCCWNKLVWLMTRTMGRWTRNSVGTTGKIEKELSTQTLTFCIALCYYQGLTPTQ